MKEIYNDSDDDDDDGNMQEKIKKKKFDPLKISNNRFHKILEGSINEENEEIENILIQN